MEYQVFVRVYWYGKFRLDVSLVGDCEGVLVCVSFGDVSLVGEGCLVCVSFGKYH